MKRLSEAREMEDATKQMMLKCHIGRGPGGLLGTGECGRKAATHSYIHNLQPLHSWFSLLCCTIAPLCTSEYTAIVWNGQLMQCCFLMAHQLSDMLSCREHNIYAPWNSIITSEIKYLKPKIEFMGLLTFTRFLMEVDRKVLLEANKNFWLKVSQWKIQILVMLMILKLYHFWCQLHVIIWGGGVKKSPLNPKYFIFKFKKKQLCFNIRHFCLPVQRSNLNSYPPQIHRLGIPPLWFFRASTDLNIDYLNSLGRAANSPYPTTAPSLV